MKHTTAANTCDCECTACKSGLCNLCGDDEYQEFLNDQNDLDCEDTEQLLSQRFKLSSKAGVRNRRRANRK